MNENGHSTGPDTIQAMKLVANSDMEVLSVDTQNINKKVYFKLYTPNAQELDG